MQQTIDIRDYIAGKREEIAARSAPFGLETLFKPGITDSDVATFFTQVSVMLGARVQLHKALEILSSQVKNRTFATVINGLLAEIRRGSPFSKALAMNPQVFDELMVVTAEVGQESGLLAEVLSGLAEYLEKMNALKKRLVQALTYPVLVLTVAAAAVGFLLVFIVPTFAEMFRSFDMTLPWSTEAVLTLSEILTQYGVLAFIGCPGLWFVFRRSLKSESVRTQLEEWIPGIPFIGEVILKNYIARFCRTLGTQLKAQVSLLDALETTRRIIPNRTLKAEIGGIIRIARQGRGVTSSIASS
ncbi:MAG: type II secretion system F family protein, partial [Ignavibacterium sp.]